MAWWILGEVPRIDGVDGSELLDGSAIDVSIAASQ
jgi:hypothetical protein